MNTNKKTPKLRFKGFTDDWEQRKFGELFILKSGVAFKLSEYTKTGIPIINGESIKAGKISLEKINYLPNEYQYKYQECLLFPGDIVLGLNRPIIDGTLKISRIPADIKKSLLYQRAGKIIFKVNMDENFTYQLLSKEVLTFTKKEAVGSDQPFITTTKLNKWDLYFPVKDKERRNIGSLFNNIDNIITLHQRKLEKLKLNKSALLQKLFPQKGCTIPDVRFKGFTDAWEQRKLGDVAIITGGGTPSTNVPEYWNGDIDWYSPVEIGKNRYVSKSTRKITKLGLEKSSAKLLPIGTVLFTSRAGIGNTAILQAEGCTNQGFQSITPDSKELDTYFLYTMTPRLKRYGEVTGAGSTFVEVSGKQMEKMSLVLPSLEEQKQIGRFFRTIDDSITLHQRKLDCLISIKKGLLQQLFV